MFCVPRSLLRMEEEFSGGLVGSPTPHSSLLHQEVSPGTQLTGSSTSTATPAHLVHLTAGNKANNGWVAGIGVCSLVTAALSLLHCHGCTVTAALSLLHCHCCTVTPARLLPRCHCCTVTATLSLLHCHSCTVTTSLSLSYFSVNIFSSVFI